jgi:hypothetical protein
MRLASKILFLTAFLLMMLQSRMIAAVSFEAGVDRLQVEFEEQVLLQLTVAVSSSEIHTTPIVPPELDGFRIGGSASSVAREGERVVRTYTYHLVPIRSGRVPIPSFQLEYVDGETTDTLTSEPLSVEIAAPRPAKSRSGLTFGLIAAAVVLVGVGITFWGVRRQKSRTPVEPDWREEYQVRFEEIKKIASRQDFRLFATEINKLIVSLLERETNGKLSGYTAGNLLKFLEENGREQAQLSQFKELLDFCEEVKYSTGKIELDKGQKAMRLSEKIVELLLK